MDILQITDPYFDPHVALTKLHRRVEPDDMVREDDTLEIVDDVIVRYNDNRYIVVPYAKGEGFPVDFILRDV